MSFIKIGLFFPPERLCFVLPPLGSCFKGSYIDIRKFLIPDILNEFFYQFIEMMNKIITFTKKIWTMQWKKKLERKTKKGKKPQWFDDDQAKSTKVYISGMNRAILESVFHHEMAYVHKMLNK